MSGFTPQIASYNADDQMASGSYDTNGNVTSTGGKSFSYDTENQFVSMNSGAVKLLYGGDGTPVAKQVSAVTTTYLVDDVNPTNHVQVLEEISGCSVQRQYTYRLELLSERQLINNSWVLSFYGYENSCEAC